MIRKFFKICLPICLISPFALYAGERDTFDKPNIVVFLIDDLGLMDTSVPFLTDGDGKPVSHPLNHWYRTPNMERLARQGTRLSRFYAHSTCSPSRISLFTGQNAARHRTTNWIHPVTNNRGEFGAPEWDWLGLREGDVSLARLLQAEGYRTIHIGKGHVGPAGTTGAHLEKLGFDVATASRETGAPGSYTGLDDFGYRTHPHYAVPDLEKYWGEDIFLTDALTLEAIREVGQAKKRGVPFFLHLSHYAVHNVYSEDDSFVMDKRFEGNYANSDKGDQPVKFATLVEGMDKSLGDLLDYLESANLAEETLIFFLGDNGSDAPLGGVEDPFGNRDAVASSAPLRGKKGTRFEGGTRVPFIAAWAKPNPENPLQKRFPLAEGRIELSAGVIYDLFPTVLDLAGAERPQDHTVDGKNLWPLLSGETDASRSFSFLSHFPHPRGDDGYYTSYQDDEWKVIYHYLPTDAFGEERYTLYHLASDPSESENVASKYPEKLSEMMQAMVEQLAHYSAVYPVDPNGETLYPQLPSTSNL